MSDPIKDAAVAMVQAPKIRMESKPFLTRPSTLVLAAITNQKRRGHSVEPRFVGCMFFFISCRLYVCKTLNQICLKKTHATSSGPQFPQPDHKEGRQQL